MATVGVTGAAGFVAGHLVAALLARGYRVVGTVRSLAVGDYLWTLPHARERLKLVEADLLRPGDFDHCFQDCVGVFHTASPFFTTMSSPEDFMRPAVEGTLNVYAACARVPSIRRIVTTSSFAAVVFGHDHTTDPTPYTEEDWNTSSSPASSNPIEVYRASKVAAEQAGLSFVAEHKPAFDIVTIHPPFVLGPWLPGYTRPNESSMIFKSILTAEAPTPSPGGLGMVDVRDVALAHVLAFETPAAHGRYLISSATAYWSEIHEFLQRVREAGTPAAIRALATSALPSHPPTRPLKPEISCAKAARDLQWQPQYSGAATLAEQCASFKETGLF